MLDAIFCRFGVDPPQQVECLSVCKETYACSPNVPRKPSGLLPTPVELGCLVFEVIGEVVDCNGGLDKSTLISILAAGHAYPSKSVKMII